MSEFADNHELVAEFLNEAGELLEEVDVKLVELESRPGDATLLNTIFRGFHTVKGGAGFLDAAALVELCHRAENLLDRLRGGKLALTPELMDLILAATGEVRRMFAEMSAGAMPSPAPAALLASIESAAHGAPAAPAPRAVPPSTAPAAPRAPGAPDWASYYSAVCGRPVEVASSEPPAAPSHSAPKAVAAGQARVPALAPAAAKETTLRVDTARFDQILNLSGEIGLARNRLACLSHALLAGSASADALKTLDEVVGALGTLVSDLQNAVMKARMQPVGRVFQKYIRQARDIARSLGKDVELELTGADTEIDKTMLDELNDPLVHLVRNAVDHGIEPPAERAAAGKPARARIRLEARQTGDHILIEIADDGRGMRPEALRAKAVEKGLLAPEAAAMLDDRQSLHLIFLPGFSTKSQVTDLSGRGVGMDVVRTNIQRLKGRVDIESQPGAGSRITIVLPLTLAILPVLTLEASGQRFAVPLGNVREVVTLSPQAVQPVSGRPHLRLRSEVLPVLSLAAALGRGDAPAALGVVVSVLDRPAVLAVDRLLGQDEVMIKPLVGVKPKGVAGATISGEGELVLVLELHELLADAPPGAAFAAAA